MLSGYSVEEIIGHSLEEFIYPEFLQNIQEQFRKALSGHLEPLEYRIKIKSGESRWIRSSIKPMRDGDRPAGFRGVLTDITSRKQIEESPISSYLVPAAACIWAGWRKRLAWTQEGEGLKEAQLFLFSGGDHRFVFRLSVVLFRSPSTGRGWPSVPA